MSCAGLALRLLPLVAALGALPGCGRAEAPAAESQPTEVVAREPAVRVRVDNVVLITIDTLRFDALGFSGGGASSPALDRLAAGGRTFPRAYAHNVVTLPSHANILTGLYPYQHGVRENGGFVLDSGIPTAATLLREAGFATAAVIGAFPLTARYGLDSGFELYDDAVPLGSRPTEIVPAERQGSEVVRRALAWWREREGQRRFLWLHLYEPHAPYEPPGELAASHPGAPYLGEVAAVDAYLAPLLEPFLAGSEPPTLIVFTSDHGEALGDHGEVTHGLFAYEATLRVPLVLWAPGVPPGRSERLARHVDLLPTVLEATGVAAPEGLPGSSLLGPAPAEPVSSYFESLTATLDRGWAPLRGIVHGTSKLIALPIPELYDLAADPGERRNLYDEERQRARQLAELLPEESAWPPPRGEVGAAERRALRSLGYLGGGADAKTSFTVEDDPKRLVQLDRKMHRVVDLYQRGRLFEAARLTREVIAERADMAIAHYYLAQILLEQGELDEAIGVMGRAREQGAASPALLRQLGLSLAEAKRYPEALAVLEPMSAAAEDPDILNALGVVLSEAGRQREARQVLERAARADAGNPVTREHLALVALRLGDWQGARTAAEAALERNSALPLAWNYLGTALYNLGAKREALSALRNSVDHQPDNFDALYNAAVVAMELGELDSARSSLRRFVAEAPPATYAADIEQARVWLRRLGE